MQCKRGETLKSLEGENVLYMAAFVYVCSPVFVCVCVCAGSPFVLITCVSTGGTLVSIITRCHHRELCEILIYLDMRSVDRL